MARTIQVTAVVPWVGSVKVPEDLVAPEGTLIEITGDRIIALFEEGFDVMLLSHESRGTWLALDQRGRRFNQR